MMKYLLIVENNNIGWATIQQIIDRDYPNLFYTSKDLQYVDVQHQVTNKHYQKKRIWLLVFQRLLRPDH